MGMEEEASSLGTRGNNLEKRVNSSGNWWQTVIDLAAGTIGVVAAYNAAGYFFSNIECSDILQVWGTAGVLAAGGIVGYKARSIFNNIRRRIKKTTARADTIKKISGDAGFMERQGIKQGKFGKLRTAAKYVLTVPLGGALGFIPGSVGILPLCVYFGAHYNLGWAENSLAAGALAGSIIGTYAYGEMAHKSQWRRMTATTAALIGATTAQIMIGGHYLDLNAINTSSEMWTSMGISASAALFFGWTTTKFYDAIKDPPRIRGRERL